MMAAESTKEVETPNETTREESTSTQVNERAIDVPDAPDEGIKYVQYTSEAQMPDIIRLMKADLSEPYSIYTYRYFIHNWPHLCILVRPSSGCRLGIAFT